MAGGAGDVADGEPDRRDEATAKADILAEGCVQLRLVEAFGPVGDAGWGDEAEAAEDGIDLVGGDLGEVSARCA